MDLKQYQIILVNLDPTIGVEMKKTRPCVIISPNEMNKYLQTIIIAPITSNSKSYPTRIVIKQSKTNGFIVLDQIRSIDKRRVVQALGILTEKEIETLKSVIQETFVD
jgi:mRNA interferase MazF